MGVSFMVPLWRQPPCAQVCGCRKYGEGCRSSVFKRHQVPSRVGAEICHKTHGILFIKDWNVPCFSSLPRTWSYCTKRTEKIWINFTALCHPAGDSLREHVFSPFRAP